MQVLLALVIAHLVGDFVVQRKAVIDGKRRGHWPVMFEHGAWHLACLVVAWLLFATAGIAAWWLAGRPDWLQAISEFWRPVSNLPGWLAVSYLVVVVAFGWLTRLALRRLAPDMMGGI